MHDAHDLWSWWNIIFSQTSLPPEKQADLMNLWEKHWHEFIQATQRETFDWNHQVLRNTILIVNEYFLIWGPSIKRYVQIKGKVGGISLKNIWNQIFMIFLWYLNTFLGRVRFCIVCVYRAFCIVQLCIWTEQLCRICVYHLQKPYY